MSLRLKLKPNEKVIVGNTVIENGPKSVSFLIHNKTTILREKDILTEETAITPAKRIYFAVQLMYMAGSLEESRNMHSQFFSLTKEFMTACPTETAINLISEMGNSILANDLYGALKTCSKLITYEEEIMGISNARVENE